MTYVVTVSAQLPPSRYDNQPWTSVRIEEALHPEGRWLPVETQPLDPVDDDPSSPQSRRVNTNLAHIARGWYRLVWIDAAGHEALGGVVRDTEIAAAEAATADVMPTVAEVAALLHARTYAGGTEQGTFTADTTPTADQATELIEMAVADVRARVGAPITVELAEDAKRLAALQAATLIEASYFPAELDTDRSAFRQYQAMYLNGIEQLTGGNRSPGALRLT